jgi:hypothetical protein
VCNFGYACTNVNMADANCNGIIKKIFSKRVNRKRLISLTKKIRKRLISLTKNKKEINFLDQKKERD